MLTHHDLTVENAEEIFENCKNSKAEYWGMKEHPLPPERMKALFSRMKECGKTTALEVVAYDLKSALRGAELAVYCDCDILMGTKFFDSVAEICLKHNIRYFPFVGTIQGRPSVLEGSVEEIINEAHDVISRGADGIDLLAYRHIENPDTLISAISKDCEVPLCIAGSIDNYEKLDKIRQFKIPFFTIGSAFFRNCFNGSFAEQIDKVIDYLEAN